MQETSSRLVARFGHARVARYFETIWNGMEAPPWSVRGETIELEKVRILSAHLHHVRSVIDCGCGGGDFLDMVAAHGGFEHVVGADLAPNALLRAERTRRYDRLVQARLDEIPDRVGGTRYDLVLLSEVLYYDAAYAKVLGRLLDHLLAPNGIVFISLALGRDYFRERDVTSVRSVLSARGLGRLVDTHIDYRIAGVPRRSLPWLRRTAWAQTHKSVLIARRVTAEASHASLG